MKKTILFYTTILIAFILSGCKEITNDTQKDSRRSDISQMPHLEKQGTATRLVVEGDPFLLIAGELHNSTAGGLKYMRPVWKRLAGKNLNSVIATVSWELIEPEEGRFDFTLVDSVIAGAREADLKLVLIWFGSWKNAGSIYMPSYVKRDYVKYPRVRDENGKPLEILSTLGNASLEKDAAAFSALMRHIKETDSIEQTVVMMQVENEIGTLDFTGKTPGNARRDFSDNANTAYYSSVPDELIQYLTAHKDNLFHELQKVWSDNGYKTSGSWEEVFGKSKFTSDPAEWKSYSYYTEELFMAWNYAKYVGAVAAAGKKEYPLPMYANAWLKQPSTFWPGRYPSGGPLPEVIDVWRAAAPSIDFIAPDIYTDEFVWTCQEFTRSSNPLFIPETVGGKKGAARAFYVTGEYDASCFAPFGIDNPRYADNDPLDAAYAVLRQMAPVILKYQGKGAMKGILADLKSPVQRFTFGGYNLEAKLDMSDSNDIAGGLIIQTGNNEFICAGRGFDLFFTPMNDSIRIALDAVDEGIFENGVWVPERRLNGDETHATTYDGTGLKFPPQDVSIQKFSFYSYK
jgi:beta-galactosidase GanA